VKCPACDSEMVKARATNHGPDYDYCRTCKKEMSELPPPAVHMTAAEVLRRREEMQEKYGRSPYAPPPPSQGAVATPSCGGPCIGQPEEHFRILGMSRCNCGILAENPNGGYWYRSAPAPHAPPPSPGTRGPGLTPPAISTIFSCAGLYHYRSRNFNPTCNCGALAIDPDGQWRQRQRLPQGISP
jgi:hypothetical protein